MSKFDALKKKLFDEISIDTDKSIEENIEKVLMVSSGLAAAVAVQPLPFADFPVITTIEIIMVKRIGEIHGYKFSIDRSKEIFLEISGVVGLAKVAQLAILTGYKTFIPFAGGFFTVPLVFAACYAIGKVADYYFTCKRKGVEFNVQVAKAIFKQAQKEGKKHGENKDNIKSI